MQWVLCVSGDRQTALQLQQLLQRLRFQADSVGGIEEALAKIRKSTPALIVVDFQLADGSGLELIRRLRQEKRAARSPILMLATAMQASHYRNRLVDPGPQEWLDKPVDDERLAAAVTRWFGVEVKPPGAVGEPDHRHAQKLADSGTFDHLPFARVLVLAGRRDRGRLHLMHHDQWIDVWLDRCRMVGISSNYLPGYSLGEMLVRNDCLSRYVLEDGKAQLSANQRLGKWLIEQGRLTMNELEEELEAHVLEKLTVPFSWRWYDGRWQFDEQTATGEAQVRCDVELRRVVFAGIACYYDRDRLEMIFSKRERLRRALIPTTPYLEEGMPVAARRLLKRADGRSSAVRVRLRSGMEVRRFYQTLYALWVLDLVRFGDPVQSENLQQLLVEETFVDTEESLGHFRR